MSTNLSMRLHRSFDGEGGSHNPVKYITVGFGPDSARIKLYRKEAPGLVLFMDPAAEDEVDLNSLPETEDFGHRSPSENKRQW